MKKKRKRSCKGCIHYYDRSIDNDGPSSCMHLDMPAFPDKRCRHYRKGG